MTQATRADFPAAQIEEWRAVSDCAAVAHEEFLREQHEAGSWLVWAIDNPDSADFARGEADKAAANAIIYRDQWRALLDETRATAYGAHLHAEVQSRLARRRDEATR